MRDVMVRNERVMDRGRRGEKGEGRERKFERIVRH